MKFKHFCGPSRSDARQRRRNFADHDEEEAALVGAERGPIKRKSPQQTAATDAYEEAGVHGAGDKRIGQFRKHRLKKQHSVMCNVQIFPLAVSRHQKKWPEKHERSRVWVAPRKAAKLVKNARLRRAIKSYQERK